ncbi:MAG TPA: LuxR C-terminal-related transcriptional regulator [Candidatus Rubrimentiphilum sp.]|nr:LuxR C-terminal-related transcriptional regulator [Candidatus Rubrimentiphilum sp.]
MFAELFAPLDRGKAAFYLAQFGSPGTLRDPLLNFASGDERLQAIAKYVHGVVELTLDHRKQGLRSLRDSFAIFDRVGYDWRAGRAALRIYEATRDRSILAIAREKLKNYTASWLGQDLMKVTKGGVDLTRMQEKVFLEICRGFSTTEIATRLKLSESTVRNHLRLVFESFGVNRRTALLAEASKRGLLP